MELLGLLGRMALVFGLLFVVLQVLKRSDALRGRSRTGGLTVTSSTRLGKTASLSVVELDGRRLVLGVTASSVTVLTELEVAAAVEAAVEAAAAPDAEPARPSFAALLAASTGRVAAAAPAPAAARTTPPSPGAFLADVWRSARRRPIETTDVSPAAIAAALALASAEPEAPAAPALIPTPRTADGTAAPRARADRRTAPRTDAQRLEKRPWSRVCRTAAPSAERSAAVV